MSKISSRLRELRKAQNVSQAELSKELSIPQTTYSGYETGSYEPNADRLLQLSDYFNVSIDYLLGKSDVKATQGEVDFLNDVKSKTLDQMIHEYNITLEGDEKMDESEERKLIKIIKMFMEKE